MSDKMVGPTKRAGDMDDIVLLESRLAKLENECRMLRIEASHWKTKFEVLDRIQRVVPDKEHIRLFNDAIKTIDRENANRPPGRKMSNEHMDACIVMTKYAVAIARMFIRRESDNG